MAYLRSHAVRFSGADAPPPNYGDAERLYAKLLEGDPRAHAAFRGLCAKADAGDARAAALVSGVRAAHARALGGDVTRASPGEREAVRKLYALFRTGSPKALSDVHAILHKAALGDPRAIRALSLLQAEHEGAKQSDLSSGAIAISEARIAQLLGLIARARAAAPPLGYHGQAPPMFPEEEPPVMGPMPTSPPTMGKYAQYMAEQQAAEARPFSITAVGPARPVAVKTAAQLSSARAVALRS